MRLNPVHHQQVTPPEGQVCRQHLSRRGTLSVELLLVLPLLLIFLAGMIEFSLLLTARQQILAASRAGARVAARGGTDDEVFQTVDRELGSGTLANHTTMVCRYDEDPNDPNDGRDRVAVSVKICVTAVVPDLLAWAGFSLRGQEMIAATTMNRE